NGDITFESVMGDAVVKEEPGAQPEMVQAMKAALTGFKGIKSTGVMSDRGISKKLDIKAPSNIDMQSRQMMDQVKEGTGNLNVPFPEEAVGAGAKWEMKKVTKVQVASVEQTGTYELVSLDGDRLNAKITMAFNAAGQKAPNAPAGAEALALSGNATGSADL